MKGHHRKAPQFPTSSVYEKKSKLKRKPRITKRGSLKVKIRVSTKSTEVEIASCASFGLPTLDDYFLKVFLTMNIVPSTLSM